MIDLRELMLRESEQVEWKANVADVDDVVRTLVAFANDLANLGGGRVVCGAHEGKDAHGFPAVTLVGLTADRLAEVRGKVVSRCRDHVSPSIAPTVEELPTDDPARRVVVFTIIATGRAHALREAERTAYWVRVDSSTREARNGLLHRLLAARGDVPPWDERLATEATVDDLDPLAIRDTLVRMQVWSQAPELDRWLDPTVRISTFMLPLCGREPLTGVVRPRNFALLLFGREPQRFVPGAVSTFSKYPGTDRGEPYNESTWHGGTLVDQARQLLAHLQQEAIGITDKSSGGPENLQKYPSRALQEALINALVHRDYTSREPVRVVAYADRVEITSPGGLDPRADRERFLRGTASPVWRNRSLAWVFIRLQLAQSEGQGIPAIQRSLEVEGSPPATFTVTDDFVTCVVPAHPRGSRVRDVMAVEEHLFAGRFDAARDRLVPLLAQDPHDPRNLSLLAHLARRTGEVGLARRHAQAIAESPALPAAARLALASALLTGPRPPARDRALVRTLLAPVHDTGGDVNPRTHADLLLRLGDEEAALSALAAAWAANPTAARDPALLALRGRATLQRARRAHTALRHPDLPGALRGSLADERDAALDAAEQDLRAARALGAAGDLRAAVQRDLRAASRMRAREV